MASRQGFGELKTEQLGGHSQEQQRHRQAPINDDVRSSARLSVCPSVRLLPSCECYTSKTNEPISMQLSINISRGKGMKARPWGSEGQRSRLQEAEVMFGDISTSKRQKCCAGVTRKLGDVRTCSYYPNTLDYHGRF